MKNPMQQKQTITQHNASLHPFALAALYPSHRTDFRLLCAFPNGASHHGREGGGHTLQVQERRHVHRHSWSQSHWPAGGHRGDGHGCAHPRESASFAGHFVARAYNNGNGVPFFSTVVVSFSPDNALDPSTWIPVPSAASAWVPHPSFPMPCSPQSCPFNDTDGLPEPGVADIGLTFLDAPLNINVATIASYSVSNPPYEGDKQKQVGTDWLKRRRPTPSFSMACSTASVESACRRRA